MYYMIDSDSDTVTAFKKLSESCKAGLSRRGEIYIPGADPVRQLFDSEHYGKSIIIVNTEKLLEMIADLISTGQHQQAETLTRACKAAWIICVKK